MLELLIPAGSPEMVSAAVQNGADAVYLGFDELTGCRQSVNFSDDSFEAALRYCHVRGCRVYLAMNALAADDELDRAAELALRAQRAGADAVVLRDLGLFRLLRQLLPEMPLFADHRLGFYTPESLQMAQRLGFRRAFLPPELPVAELCRLSKDAPLETAVFVQTALCPAVAATCHMSALSGRDSADRGLCGETCRNRFSLGNPRDDAPLSIRDRCLLRDVAALAEAGVACACVGGRENRPEYAAAFAAAFGPAIRLGKPLAQEDLRQLETVFSAHGFAAGDGPEPARQPEKPSRGTERYCSQLRRSYMENELRRVPVRFAVVARSEREPVCVGVQDDEGHSAMQNGPIPRPAGELPLTQEALDEAMYRTSGTPFRCEKVFVQAAEGLRLSEQELDAARRELLFKLSEARAVAPERKEGLPPLPPSSATPPLEPHFNFSFLSREQMTGELAALRPHCVYLPLELAATDPGALEPFLAEGATPVAVLPAAVSGPEEEQRLRGLLAQAKQAGIEQALTGNLGLALPAREAGMTLRADGALGAWNALALQSLAAAGFLSALLPFEQTLEKLRALSKPLDTELLVYGRLPAMVTTFCILKTSAGRCTCTTPGQLADAKGGIWPVTRDFGCRNAIWSDKKLWLGGRAAEDWRRCGLWAVRLAFTTESARECLEVARSYMEGSGYSPNGKTRGLYYRGVL